MKDLIKKQEEEFSKIFRTSRDCISLYGSEEKIQNFISKVRKETAEAVADKMIGKPYLREHPFSEQLDEDEVGYNIRIKEEKEIKKQIIENL